ncbi:MAG: hisH [Bacteroidota bacterium]|jgi:glutamine amidotransferase|nr:hisH [Bacteroidota bacterium]
MIAIIDYGCGNLGSIKNMIRKIGGEAVITSNIDEIRQAKKIILPGVGSFDTGMNNLKKSGFIDILNEKAFNEKVPFLGICLGMQLMTKGSEEGSEPGLAWFDAETIKFKFEKSSVNKIPNMGWKHVYQKKESAYLKEMYPEPRFYFVHSYYVKSNKPEDVLTTSTYGTEYVSGFEKGNLCGVQFHPEKSHKFGMKLFTNFLSI